MMAQHSTRQVRSSLSFEQPHVPDVILNESKLSRFILLTLYECTIARYGYAKWTYNVHIYIYT